VKLKLDENLSRHLKQALSSLQHDVATAAEQGLLSKPDTVVAAAANVEGRMLLTLGQALISGSTHLEVILGLSCFGREVSARWRSTGLSETLCKIPTWNLW
jgi:hypothetical protein